MCIAAEPPSTPAKKTVFAQTHEHRQIFRSPPAGPPNQPGARLRSLFFRLVREPAARDEERKETRHRRCQRQRQRLRQRLAQRLRQRLRRIVRRSTQRAYCSSTCYCCCCCFCCSCASLFYLYDHLADTGRTTAAGTTALFIVSPNANELKRSLTVCRIYYVHIFVYNAAQLAVAFVSFAGCAA